MIEWTLVMWIVGFGSFVVPYFHTEEACLKAGRGLYEVMGTGPSKIGRGETIATLVCLSSNGELRGVMPVSPVSPVSPLPKEGGG